MSSQTNSGFRTILNNPVLYELLQKLVRKNDNRSWFVEEKVQPFPGMRLLDIGCGPGTILDFLPEEVKYVGFDLSEAYINQAVSRYGTRGTFHCGRVSEMLTKDLPAFDAAMARGVIHHLDDKGALELFQLAHQTLVSGGRLVTLDNCFLEKQSPIAKFIISKDRGQKVRYPSEYKKLALEVFQEVKGEAIGNLLRIPYNHYLMECIKE